MRILRRCLGSWRHRQPRCALSLGVVGDIEARRGEGKARQARGKRWEAKTMEPKEAGAEEPRGRREQFLLKRLADSILL